MNTLKHQPKSTKRNRNLILEKVANSVRLAWNVIGNCEIASIFALQVDHMLRKQVKGNKGFSGGSGFWYIQPARLGSSESSPVCFVGNKMPG